MQNHLKRVLIGGLLLLLAACGGAGDSGGVPVSQNNPIEWDRSPTTIVFRADVTGGNLDPFIARSEIPPCTIYGDNHIVWTNELGVNNIQVLEDRLTDQQVRDFVSFLAINQEIYKYNAQADLQIPTDVRPVVESLTLFVNGVNHKTDAFGGWTSDYYENILLNCRGLSRAPVIYVPAGAWVSALEVPYSSDSLRTPWSASASGLNLSELAASGERRWITGQNVPILWNLFRTSPLNIQFFEDDTQYNLALEIPNITRESPPPPA